LGIKFNIHDFYREVKERTGYYYSTDCFVVGMNWAKKWLNWIDFDEPEPGRIDNSDIICQHGLFVCTNRSIEIDPLRPYCVVIQRDWRELKSNYPCEQEISISLSKSYHSGDSSVSISKSNPEICEKCSEERRNVMEVEASIFENTSLRIIDKPYSINNRETQIKASYNMTVGELKLHIFQVWDLMPSEQLLKYDTVELMDDSRLLSEYGVTPLKPLILARAKVGDYFDYNDFLTPVSPPSYAPQKEIGFEGTFLTGSQEKPPEKKQ